MTKAELLRKMQEDNVLMLTEISKLRLRLFECEKKIAFLEAWTVKKQSDIVPGANPSD